MFKNNKIIKNLIIGTGLLFVSLMLTGCNGLSQNDLSPEKVIKDAYGNNAYKITFDTNGAEPINDIEYTASYMPTLPTPVKVGYIFSGWYMDENLLTPYSDGMLYLYMSNVTLYAKWEKELIVQDGIYEFEYSLNVVEDSIVAKTNGNTAAIDGFLNDIDKNDIYIEKGGDKILLKFAYDNKTFKKFNNVNTYSISINTNLMGSQIYLNNAIENLAETRRTYFYNINQFVENDLSQSIYFHVIAYDYDADSSVIDVEKTKCEFDLEFRITRFVGLTKGFINPNTELDEGYYQAKVSFYKPNGEFSNMHAYNPVYSYIKVSKDDNGKKHYTLIKSFYPYTFADSGNLVDNVELYHNRLSTFVLPSFPYEMGIDARDEKGNQIAKYGNFIDETIIEFHADEGKFYFIFDLGMDLTKTISLNAGLAGIMEIMFAMGTVDVVMGIDYNHITKLNNCDYKELEGNTFSINEKVYGSAPVKDISDDLLYDEYKKYGNFTYVPLYYFAAHNINNVYDSKIFSYRLSITPNFSDLKVTNSKKIMEFNRNIKIYDYDEKNDGDLYADSITLDTAKTSKSSCHREVLPMKLGKSFNVGDIINIDELYNELVNKNGDYTVATIYPIINGKIDYSTKLEYDKTFEFNDNVVIYYVRNNGQYKEKSLLYLTKKTTPTIWFDLNGSIYDPNNCYYDLKSTIDFPDLHYEWDGIEGSFISAYYADDEEDISQYSLKPNFVRTYYVDEYGNYILFDLKKNGSDEEESFTFNLGYNEIVFVYDLINPYKERYQYELRFIASEKETTNAKFYIDDELITTYIVGDSESRTGKDINDNGRLYNYAIVLSSYEKLEEALEKEYYSIINGVRSDFYIDEVSISSDNISESNHFYKDIDGDLKEIIKNYLKTSKRAIVGLYYTDGVDKYREIYSYGITFNGEKDFYPIKYDNLYTNITYPLVLFKLYDTDGTQIGKVNRVNIVREGLSSLSTSYITPTNDFVNLSFDSIGNYRIEFYVQFTYDVNGVQVFGNQRYVSVIYTMNVYVSNSDGYGMITYVTDSSHPFSDGSLEKTYTYLLKDKFKLPQQNEFEKSNGILIAWKTKDFYTFEDGGYDAGGRLLYVTNEVSDMITYFNSSNVTLYAEWDMGVSFIINVDPLAMKNGVSVLNADYKYYLEGTSFKYSYYQVPYSDLFDLIKKYMRSDCELVGIEYNGKIIYDNNVTTSLTATITKDTYATAIIKKSYKVEFVVDYSITSSAFKDEKILEGNTVSKSNKEELKIKKEGYSFLYWATIEDDVPTKFDLDTPITKNMVLYAIFEDPDGNLVWGVY